jgi:transposase-like protein
VARSRQAAEQHGREAQYYYWLKQMSRKGWRTEGPAELNGAPEKPRLMRRVAEVL